MTRILLILLALYFSLGSRAMGTNEDVGHSPIAARAAQAARAAKAGVRMVNPTELRWSQDTAGGRGRAAEIRSSMSEREWASDPIDVVQIPDGLVTLDHTRAAVALEQEIPQIPVRVHAPMDPLPADMLSRPWNQSGATATAWGEVFRLRGAGQTPPIGLTGSPTPPRLLGRVKEGQFSHMNDYLFRFGCCTPLQWESNRAHGWDDEASSAFFISADTREPTFVWGCEIAERYVRHLFERSGATSIPSWKESEFAFWIDYAPTESLSAEELVSLSRVREKEVPESQN